MRKNHSCKNVILLSVSSGILAATAFDPCSFTSLIWIALVPWLYTLTQQTWKQMFLSHLLFHTSFFSIGIFWTTRVHPICLFGILLALYIMCLPFPLLFFWISKKKQIPLFILAPVLWCSNEYLRAFLFSGFPYLFLGHSQAFNPQLIQIADITGVYGVSFLIMACNALVLSWINYWIDTKKKKPVPQVIYSVITIGLLILFLVYGHIKLKKYSSYKRGPKIASIQGNIPQDIKDNQKLKLKHILNSYTELTVKALKQKPKLLIWPETMSPDDPLLDPHMSTMFKDIATRTHTYLLIGSHHLECDFKEKKYKTYNSAYFINTEGKIVNRYDKRKLVIIGEYLPLRSVLPFLPTIIKNIAGFVPDLAEGKKQTVFEMGKDKFGCLICYDIAYPQEVGVLKEKGCDFVINMTNEGWFFDTSELEQLLKISIFRAVEHRIGILRSANTGITANIPPNGVVEDDDILTMPIDEYPDLLKPYMKEKVINQSAFAWHNLPEAIWSDDIDFFTTKDKNWDIMLGKQKLKWKDFAGVFCKEVPLGSKTITFYTKFGDLFVIILSGLSLLFCIISFKTKNISETA